MSKSGSSGVKVQSLGTSPELPQRKARGKQVSLEVVWWFGSASLMNSKTCLAMFAMSWCPLLSRGPKQERQNQPFRPFSTSVSSENPFIGIPMHSLGLENMPPQTTPPGTTTPGLEHGSPPWQSRMAVVFGVGASAPSTFRRVFTYFVWTSPLVKSLAGRLVSLVT